MHFPFQDHEDMQIHFPSTALLSLTDACFQPNLRLREALNLVIHAIAFDSEAPSIS